MTTPSQILSTRTFKKTISKERLDKLILAEPASNEMLSLNVFKEIFDLVLGSFAQADNYEDYIVRAAEVVDPLLRSMKESLGNENDTSVVFGKLVEAVVGLYKHHYTTTSLSSKSQSDLFKILFAPQDFELIAAFYKKPTTINKDVKLSKELILKYALNEVAKLVDLPELIELGKFSGKDLVLDVRNRVAKQIQALCQEIEDPALKEALIVDVVELYIATKKYFTIGELKNLIDSLPAANRDISYGKLLQVLSSENPVTNDDFFTIVVSASPSTRSRMLPIVLSSIIGKSTVSIDLIIKYIDFLPEAEKNKSYTQALALLIDKTDLPNLHHRLPADYVWDHKYKIDEVATGFNEYNRSTNCRFNEKGYSLCKTDAERETFAKRWYETVVKTRDGTFDQAKKVNFKDLYSIPALKPTIEQAALAGNTAAIKDLLENIATDYKNQQSISMQQLVQIVALMKNGYYPDSIQGQLATIASDQLEKAVAAKMEGESVTNAHVILKYLTNASTTYSSRAVMDLTILEAMTGDQKAITQIFTNFSKYSGTLREYANSPTDKLAIIFSHVDPQYAIPCTTEVLSDAMNDPTTLALRHKPFAQVKKVLEYLAASGFKRANAALGYIYATGNTLSEGNVVPVHPRWAASYYRAAGVEHYPGYYRTPEFARTPVLYAYALKQTVALTLGASTVNNDQPYFEVLEHERPRCAVAEYRRG